MMIEQDFDFEIVDYVIHRFVVQYKLLGLFILQDIRAICYILSLEIKVLWLKR